MLLDINNVYVNSINFNRRPGDYLDRVDVSQIGQIHLAGHSDTGKFLFDTHSSAVSPEVWSLFDKVRVKIRSPIPVL
ncbi:multinuclear nonheme iron-dependent oxidase, partial [Aeromonas veronii]|uniref:multinuclear nonheme iron-dependent oxidase n=1 Tax=Aeromonas veronii TaxID=654 RepID=UPI00406C3309